MKADNCLLKADNSVCITDFGICQLASSLISHPASGTRAYMAPELNAGSVSRYTFPLDIWALGLLLREMTCLDMAPESQGEKAPPALPTPPFPAVVVAVIERCLDLSPKRRPSASEVLQSLQRYSSSTKHV
jgi:serine/threonine protein kinase